MDIEQLLEETGVFLRGHHFVYTGTEHGLDHLQFRKLYKHPNYNQHLAELSLALIERVIQIGNVDVTLPTAIVGPDTVGAVIAEAAAARFNGEYGTSLEYHRIEIKKDEDGSRRFLWERPPQGSPQIIFLDDVRNAGRTFERTRPMMDACGKLVAAGAIVDRSAKDANDLGIPFGSLLKLTLPRFAESSCPLCQELVPIVTNVGHGEDYQRLHPNYAGGFIEL